jgi:DNA-binding YbaB/EbfC family protein
VQPELKTFMQRAERLQQQMLDAQDELARSVVTGRAGDGLLTVTVSGLGELKSVRIDPALFDRGSVEQLQDMFVEAIHDGAESVRQLASAKMGPVEVLSVY